MAAADTAALLAGFHRRGAGTNSERLAALWLRDEVQSPRRDAFIETFWCRPGWALAHSWHAALALAGSLIAVSDARLGGALLVLALVCIASDAWTGYSPGRRLTPERASQNVVSTPMPTAANAAVTGEAPTPDTSVSPARVRLIVTANYDAGRAGLAYRPGLRRAAAAIRRVAGGGRFIPGWLGWMAIALVWLIVAAVLRNGGATGSAIGVAQLVPTVGLVLELALLLELAASDFGPAAGDNAAGAGMALALVRALDASPPRHLNVELVLGGAGDGQMIGLTRHLRARRRELRPSNTVVLGFGPSGSGTTRWWTGDGNLVPLRYHRRLGALVQSLIESPDGPGAYPYRGRGCAPAFPARRAGLPAINLGCLDGRSLPVRSHLAGDTPDTLDGAAMDELLQLALMIVDALDADLARAATPSPEAESPAAASPAHL